MNIYELKNVGTGSTTIFLLTSKVSRIGIAYWLSVLPSKASNAGTGSTAALLINCLNISKLPYKHKLCHHNIKEATPPLSASTAGSLFFLPTGSRVGTGNNVAMLYVHFLLNVDSPHKLICSLI